MIMDIIYKTCNQCKGNGYNTVLLKTCNVKFPERVTVTCYSCGGAGYFYPSKTNNETRTTDLNPTQESVSCQQP